MPNSSTTASPAAPDGKPLPPVHGHLDTVTFERLRGWAWYPGHPHATVTVRVMADDVVIGRAVANLHRSDVQSAGIGTGRYGFELTTEFQPPLRSCLIAVVDDATGLALAGSPARLEPPVHLAAAAAAITALFESPGSDDELRRRAEFAAGHADALLQRLADRRSSRVARAAQRARKWRWRKEDGPEPRRLAPRALVIDTALPAMGRDAGSNALLSHLASLRRLGFDVLFAPADMQGGAGTAVLEDMGIGVAAAPWYASVEEVMRREGAEFDLVYVHRHETAVRYLALAGHLMPRARRLYAVADLHGLRLSRQGEVEERPELIAHARVVHQAEMTAAAASHAVITHSTVEAAILRRAVPQGRVEVVPWHVPAAPTPQGFADRQGLVFIGSYSHAPNLDAALWLRDEVMPLVWAADPSITCTLAGSGLPRVLQEGNDPRVRAAGAVESLAELFGGVRLSVAPLAYGAGLKGKVVDSLALGVPCICTPVAAEGFDLPPPLQGLVAEDAAGLAASILRLHGDAALFAACRAAGLSLVGEGFSEAVVDAGLQRAIGVPGLVPDAPALGVNA